MANKSFAAPRGEFKVNNVVVAFCTGVSGNENIARRPIRPVGTVEAVERPAVAVDVSFSANMVRIVGLDIVQQGLVGGRDTASLLDEGEAILELYDKVGDKPIYVVMGAVPTNMGFGMMSGDVVTTSVNFEARKLLRESEIS